MWLLPLVLLGMALPLLMALLIKDGFAMRRESPIIEEQNRNDTLVGLAAKDTLNGGNGTDNADTDGIDVLIGIENAF